MMVNLHMYLTKEVSQNLWNIKENLENAIQEVVSKPDFMNTFSFNLHNGLMK